MWYPSWWQFDFDSFGFTANCPEPLIQSTLRQCLLTPVHSIPWRYGLLCNKNLQSNVSLIVRIVPTYSSCPSGVHDLTTLRFPSTSSGISYAEALFSWLSKRQMSLQTNLNIHRIFVDASFLAAFVGHFDDCKYDLVARSYWLAYINISSTYCIHYVWPT